MKPLKFPREFKEFNTLVERLLEVESKLPPERTAAPRREEGKEQREETRGEYHHKCAELRRARIAAYKQIMTETEAYQLCGYMSSDYEIGKPYELRLSAEERYQRRKKDWQHHDTSWCMRNVEMNDENSCNYSRCIPACRYYPETGRIEDREVIKKHEEYWAEQRKLGEEMLAQKQKEHAEWIALTEEERELRRQQRIQDWKEREAWGMANQRGELGPINQLTPPQWWLDQYRRQKQQGQQRVL